ncbi:MAG TPA: NADPH:quinone oxidoreductase family protein [Candidatus Methylomirabilis sp.]|nr:NADPH:quinone oxidoreductase family protein [Candidatus Methylomirabilis sp.]
MKAIRVHEPGGPEALQYEEAPDPRPEPGEVLIRVEAAGINFADTLARKGLYPTSTPPPFIPGFEVAGTVIEVGAGVKEITRGERVTGFAPKGGYAELAVMPAASAIPVPEPMTFEEAAAFPIVFLTAYHALKSFGRLRQGESVLIHAAGGGVGTAAVQLAKVWGARVFATAGSDEKLSGVKGLGADEVLNYRTADFAEAVRRWTGGRGVDIILESVGGEVFEKSLITRSRRATGRHWLLKRRAATTSPRPARYEWALRPRTTHWSDDAEAAGTDQDLGPGADRAVGQRKDQTGCRPRLPPAGGGRGTPDSGGQGKLREAGPQAIMHGIIFSQPISCPHIRGREVIWNLTDANFKKE